MAMESRYADYLNYSRLPGDGVDFVVDHDATPTLLPWSMSLDLLNSSTMHHNRSQNAT